MKASELIKLLEDEVKFNGDPEITIYCFVHSGEDGDPIAIHGLGWCSDSKNRRSSFIECYECHCEAMDEKAWSDAMDEIENQSSGYQEDFE